MVINIDTYRSKKKNANEEYVMAPVYERVYIEDNKLIGECSKGYKSIIKDYNNEK